MRQIASKDLTHELPLAREPNHADVPGALIYAQKSAAAAVCLACQVSGLDDKEIYLSIGMDPAQWSRVRKGEANFPNDKVADFCKVVGNVIYPEWIAYQIGCTLVMLKSEAERRADEAETRAKDAEAQVAMLKNLLIGKAA